MPAEEIKSAAIEILKLSGAMNPADFVTACGMAASSIIRVCWKPEDREQCVQAYTAALRLALKES